MPLCLLFRHTRLFAQLNVSQIIRSLLQCQALAIYLLYLKRESWGSVPGMLVVLLEFLCLMLAWEKEYSSQNNTHN